jgi:hypothetical protein
MSRSAIPFSQLTIPELLTLHNTLAQQSGEPTRKTWSDSRGRLVERVAILRTLPFKKVAAAAKRRSDERARPLTLFILKTLAIVDHYQIAETGERITKAQAANWPRNTIISVGLAYPEVLERVQLEFPEARTSTLMLRQMAWQVRNHEPKNGIHPKDFDAFTMPDKRPHTSKRKESA